MPKPKPKRKTAIERAIVRLEKEHSKACKLALKKQIGMVPYFMGKQDGYSNSIDILREEAKRG